MDVEEPAKFEVEAKAWALGAELARTGNTALFLDKMSLMSDIISILLFIMEDEGEDELLNVPIVDLFDGWEGPSWLSEVIIG